MTNNERDVLSKFFENKYMEAIDGDELSKVREIVDCLRGKNFSYRVLKEVLAVDDVKSFHVIKERMGLLNELLVENDSDKQNTSLNSFTIVDLLRAFNDEKLSDMKLDRKDIESICNKLINPVEKALIMGSFEGIKGYSWDDFLQLELKHIDQENNMVYLPVRKTSISISANLTNYLVDACNADSWISHSGSTLPYSEGDTHVIKRVRRKVNESNDEAEPHTAYYIFKNSLKYLGISDNVSLRTVWRSGIIDYLGSETWQEFRNDFNTRRSDLMNQFDMTPSAVKNNKGLIFKKYFA